MASTAQVQVITTSLKVHSLQTYEELCNGFEVEVYRMDTEIYGNGVDSSLPASAVTAGKISGSPIRSAPIAGHKKGFMTESSEVIFQGLEKFKYYIVRYRVTTTDGRFSPWYQEKEQIGDTSVSATLSNKAVISDNGVIKASFEVATLPTDYKEVHWFVRDAATVPAATDAPDYVTTQYSLSGTTAQFQLDIPAYGNKNVYAFIIDHSRNRHNSGVGESIGTVAGLTAPGTPTLLYTAGVVRISVSYNFTTYPDIQKIEFDVSRDGGSNWVVHEVLRPDDAAGATTMQLEIPYEPSQTFTCRLRAINSINMQSSYSSSGSVTCPAVMEVVDLNADIFHFDKMGYGSARGIYPSTINGVPQLRGEYFSKFGGAMEFAEATTNLISNPQLTAETGWSKYQTFTTVEYLSISNPVGSPGVLHIVGNGDTNDYWQYIQARTSAGSTYSHSVYLKGSGTLRIAAYDNVSSYQDSALITLTSEWVRYTLPNKTYGVGSTDRRFFPVKALSNGGEVYVCAPQSEAGSLCTPADIIGTDGATARVAQYLKYNTATLVDWSAGSLSLWFTPDFEWDEAGGDAYLIYIYTGVSDRFLFKYDQSSENFVVYMSDGSTSTIDAAELQFSRGDRIHLAVTWDGSNYFLYVDGVKDADLHNVVRDVTLGDNMYIGSNDAGGTSLNGCIDELIFWKGRTLTDQEVLKLYELEVPNSHPNPIKAVAPIVVPASDFVYDQPASQGQLSNHTFSQLNQRTTVREVS